MNFFKMNIYLNDYDTIVQLNTVLYTTATATTTSISSENIKLFFLKSNKMCNHQTLAGG